MKHYNFFEDLFDTYQSLSTFMQLAWLVMPFAFICMMFATWLLHKRQSRELEAEIERRAVERYVLDLGSREAYAPPSSYARPAPYPRPSHHRTHETSTPTVTQSYIELEERMIDRERKEMEG